jgi:hypothetical protein
MAGDRTSVADRLTQLVDLADVHVNAKNFWMPQGLPVAKANGEWDKDPTREAKLGVEANFLSPDQSKEITNWWLAAPMEANTPNWDIASTCTIREKPGLLLVEAKAHCAEVKQDGKPLRNEASPESLANHEKIGRAIAAASAGLDNAMPGWNLSRDSHYQLANRFAWTWKLASMGIPVVLVYLGFLDAAEMNDLGESFVDCASWTRVVLDHSRNIVPEQAWGGNIEVDGTSIEPLIRTSKQSFLP